MSTEDLNVVLASLTYGTPGGLDRGTTIKNVTYIGVIERKSDGLTVLSVRKPGSSRAFNIETGAIVSITAHGREWRPSADVSRWALRAAEIRSFVERVPLEEWAQPYFDPSHAKFHGNRPRYEEDVALPARDIVIRVGVGDSTEPLAGRPRHYDEEADRLAREDDARRGRSLLVRFWCWLTRGR